MLRHGALIEVLTEMQCRETTTESRPAQLHDRICNESIYGIDFGKNPLIARMPDQLVPSR